MKALKRVARSIGIILLVILVIGMIITFAIPNQDVIRNARASVEYVSWILMCSRLIVIGVAWYFWNDYFKWYYDGKSNEVLAYVQSKRTRFLILFLAIEFLLIQNILGAVWSWLGQ